MSTTRLKIYNGALMLCGEVRLASVDENREARHLLDEVWNDGGQRYCLEQAQWQFAMRSSRLDYNTDVQPDWGFPRAFDKPVDWVATSGVFQDEFMRAPLLDYADEVGYWYANLDQIFVRYVSDDENYGLNLSLWPTTFTDYVKAYFASRIVHKMPGGAARITALLGADASGEKSGVLHAALLTAKNKSAMTQPATFPNRGTWARARYAGSRLGRRDGGNPNQLIG